MNAAEPDLFGGVTPIEPTAEEKRKREALDGLTQAKAIAAPAAVAPEPAPIEESPAEDAAVAEDGTFRDKDGRLWMRAGTRGWKRIEGPALQDALFDDAVLDDLTEEDPEADLKARLDERGVSAAAYKATYDAATIKQVVLYFRGDTFTRVLERLRAVGRKTGVDNNTDIVLKLLDFYERTPDDTDGRY